MADGQSTSQLHRWFRRAGLPDVSEHRDGATTEDAGHTATYQDDPQTTNQAARRTTASP